MRRFRVTLDYVRERMLLVPGLHFADTAPEDRSGLMLRLAGDGQRLRIEEVAEGSAGARAGIRAGESLTMIDGAPVPDLGLRRAQALLTVPGAGLRLQIEGESTCREVMLPLPGTDR